MIRRCAGLLIFFVSYSMSQVAQQQCAVEGKVVNSITGEALSHATVSLNKPASGSGFIRSVSVAGVQSTESTAPPPVHTTSTGDQGRFCIPPVPPGTYSLRGSRTGFLDYDYDSRGRTRPSPSVKVVVGEAIKDQIVRLTPQSVITGRVFDEDGQPVAKASVKLMAAGYFRGQRQLITHRSAETDNRGEYRIPGITPGQYMVLAAPPSRRSDPGAVIVSSGVGKAALIPAYYPGVGDVATASKFELSAGVERGGLDIRLRSGTAFRIKGTVLDHSGQPLARALVSAIQAVTYWYAGYGVCFTAADGTFELSGVPAGMYSLQAYKSPHGTVANQKLEVSGDVEGLVLKSEESRSVVGSAVVKGGAKAALGTIQILLQPETRGFNSVFGEVKQDGGFMLERVKSDRYRFYAARLPENLYVAAVNASGRQFSGPDLDFTSGVPERLEIVLGSDGGRLNGIVTRKGAPAAGVLLALVPADYLHRPRWFRRVELTNQRGEYSITGIAPGQYTLLAWDDPEPGEVEDPEFLSKYVGRGVKISIEGGASAEVNPPLLQKEP